MCIYRTSSRSISSSKKTFINQGDIPVQRWWSFVVSRFCHSWYLCWCWQYWRSKAKHILVVALSSLHSFKWYLAGQQLLLLVLSNQVSSAAVLWKLSASLACVLLSMALQFLVLTGTWPCSFLTSVQPTLNHVTLFLKKLAHARTHPPWGFFFFCHFRPPWRFFIFNSSNSRS
jgi:hypothetical protein